MGSPTSLIVANLYIEDFQVKAINTTEHPPRIRRRYVNDTFIVQKTSDRDRFYEIINSVNIYIQFTVKETRADGSMFFDTSVMPEPDRSPATTVYRKPTHTNLYLQWDSYHNLSASYSVINALTHRTRTVCFTPGC